MTIMFRGCDRVAQATKSLTLAGIGCRRRALLFWLDAFAAAAAACDDHRADGNRARLPIRARVPQQFPEVATLGPVPQAQLCQGASFLCHVNVVASERY